MHADIEGCRLPYLEHCQVGVHDARSCVHTSTGYVGGHNMFSIHARR